MIMNLWCPEMISRYDDKYEILALAILPFSFKIHNKFSLCSQHLQNDR